MIAIVFLSGVTPLNTNGFKDMVTQDFMVSAAKSRSDSLPVTLKSVLLLSTYTRVCNAVNFVWLIEMCSKFTFSAIEFQSWAGVSYIQMLLIYKDRLMERHQQLFILIIIILFSLYRYSQVHLLSLSYHVIITLIYCFRCYKQDGDLGAQVLWFAQGDFKPQMRAAAIKGWTNKFSVYGEKWSNYQSIAVQLEGCSMSWVHEQRKTPWPAVRRGLRNEQLSEIRWRENRANICRLV